MLNLNSLQGIVDTLVMNGADQSVPTKAALALPAGEYVITLTEYIETGVHIPKTFGNKADVSNKVGKAALHVRLGFVIRDTANPQFLHRINLPEMQISNFEKSGYHRVFKGMTGNNNSIRHMAQLLGKSFMGSLKEHTTVAGKEMLVLDRTSLAAMRMFSATTGEPIAPVELTLQEQEKHLKLFLWNNPTKETWDSLFIEKANFIQERCLESLDYSESSLRAMLNNSERRSVRSNGLTNFA